MGRWGCFFNGDDFGLPTSKIGYLEEQPWWAVTFPNHPNPVPRIPTQIIESITVGCCLLGVLSRFREITAKWGEGAVGAMMIGSYAFIRFFDEYLRADFRGHSPISGLSPSQFLSIVVLTLASLFL